MRGKKEAVKDEEEEELLFTSEGRRVSGNSGRGMA